MKDLLIPYIHILVAAVSLIELVFVLLFVRSYRRDKRPVNLCFLVIAIGLFLDSVLIAAGSFSPSGIPASVSRLLYADLLNYRANNRHSGTDLFLFHVWRGPDAVILLSVL